MSPRQIMSEGILTILNSSRERELQVKFQQRIIVLWYWKVHVKKPLERSCCVPLCSITYVSPCDAEAMLVSVTHSVHAELEE